LVRNSQAESFGKITIAESGQLTRTPSANCSMFCAARGVLKSRQSSNRPRLPLKVSIQVTKSLPSFSNVYLLITDLFIKESSENKLCVQFEIPTLFQHTFTIKELYQQPWSNLMDDFGLWNDTPDTRCGKTPV